MSAACACVGDTHKVASTWLPSSACVLCCVQVKLQDMRAKLPDLVDPKSAEQEQQDDDDAAGHPEQQHDQQQRQQQAGASQPAQQQQQHGSFEDMDDDEFLQLQAETALVSPVERHGNSSSFLRLQLHHVSRGQIAPPPLLYTC